MTAILVPPVNGFAPFSWPCGTADRPFPERMTWFWHGHFATSIQKVRYANLMAIQNASQRRLGTGDFRALAQAMAVDPAMLLWLDGGGNRVGKPNENLAREFMELFTLGVGNYTEDDVRAAARALTGWTVNVASSSATFVPKRHDPGPETVLGTVRRRHDEPGGRARRDAGVGPLPRDAGVDAGSSPTRRPTRARSARSLNAYGAEHDVTALVRAAARTPAFRDPGSVLVREPVLWLTGALRALNVPASKVHAGSLAAGLSGLGQVPFAPPNVGGWPAGTPWLTTAVGAGPAEPGPGGRERRRPLPGHRRPEERPRGRDRRPARTARLHPAHGRRAGPAHREPAAARRDRARLPGKLRERMNALTRRRFLLASGAAAVAATAATVGWKDLADRTRSDPLPVGTGVLVLVTLYGGNDGLNTVVPAADPAYQSARPDLAYAQGEVLDIGEGLGLNPGLAGPQAAVGQRHAGHRPRRQLPEARPQPLPFDGHLADRLARPPRGHRVDRPLAGRQRPRPALRRVAGAGAAADAGGRDHGGRRAAAARARPAERAARDRVHGARAAVRGGVAAAGLRRALDHRPAPDGGHVRQGRGCEGEDHGQAGCARGPARRGRALRRGGRPGPGVLGEPRRVRHPRRRARHAAAPAHGGRPGRLGVPHADGGHRARPRRGA